MIVIACDQGGFSLKKKLINYLSEKKIAFIEKGCMSGENCDYPLVAKEACRPVQTGEADSAVLICGTGVGISMAANKMKGIRAAVCSDVYTAKYARLHNDANALCLGGRVTGSGAAIMILETFLETGFEGGRHERRVSQIMEIEKM